MLNEMKRTYIIPNFNIMDMMCESAIIASSIQISKGTINNSEDIGFVKGDDMLDDESEGLWE